MSNPDTDFISTTLDSPTTTTTSTDPTASAAVSLYFYSPSTPLAITLSLLYLLLTLWHLSITLLSTRHVPQKHKYTIPLSIAAVIATAGWALRIPSIHHPSSIPLYATSASFVVVSPIFVCASLYLLLKHLIRTTLPAGKEQVFLKVGPRTLGRVFITSDVLSFLTQCAGSGIASSGGWKGDLKVLGTDVLLCGLALQVVTFSIFLVVLGGFLRRVKRHKEVGLNPCVKRVVRAVWIAGFLVQVRSVYRVVEFIMGVERYLFEHEWCLYVFEGAPMFLALSVLAWYHPVKWMQQKSRAEFNLQDGVADARRPNGLLALVGKGSLK